MADGTSLGWGIALQNKFKNDYEGNRVIEDAFRRKAAADAQKEKDAVSRLDFKIDYNKFYPVIGKAIADEEAKLYRQYALYKQQDKNTAFNRIQEDFIRAKQRIGQLAQTNDQYKAYESLDPTKFVREADLLKTINSQDATFDDLMKFRKPGYLNIGDNGEFSFKPVPHYKMESQYSNNEYDEEERTYYSIPVPGKKGSLSVRRPSDLTIQRKANERVKDPKFLENLYYFKPELQGDAEGTVKAAFEAEKSIAPIPVQDRGEVDIDIPKDKDEVTSLSLDEAVKAGKVSVDVKQNVLAPKTEYYTKNDADVKSGDKRVGQAKQTSRVASEGNVYFAMDVIDTKPVSVVKSFDVFDVKENKRLPKDQTGNIVIKPGRIQVIAVRDGKKWVAKPYVYGTATEEGVTTTEGVLAGSTRTQTDLQYAVPLESVRNSIELKNDIKWVDEAVQRAQEKIDANYKQGSYNTSKTTTYKFKMTNKQGKTIYTDGEKWYDENGNAI